MSQESAPAAALALLSAGQIYTHHNQGLFMMFKYVYTCLPMLSGYMLVRISISKSTYIYIYIYIYIHTYIHRYIYIGIDRHMYIYIYILI